MATSWTRFRRDKTAIAGLAVIALIVAAAALAPLLAPFDPSFQAVDGLTDDGSPVPPNGEFWLGTDLLGRDLLSRMIFGARNSLIIGLVANGAAVL
ncbi:MAG: ABC transporter permease, partial [Dongiaceae bacterium]